MNSKKRKFFPAFRLMIFTKTEYHNNFTVQMYRIQCFVGSAIQSNPGNFKQVDSFIFIEY